MSEVCRSATVPQKSCSSIASRQPAATNVDEDQRAHEKQRPTATKARKHAGGPGHSAVTHLRDENELAGLDLCDHAQQRLHTLGLQPPALRPATLHHRHLVASSAMSEPQTHPDRQLR
eukprot:1156985-Rhodomonas_salina.2